MPQLRTALVCDKGLTWHGPYSGSVVLCRVEEFERQAAISQQEQAWLQEQLSGMEAQYTELQERLAAAAAEAGLHRKRLAELGEAVEELERENSSLEAQVRCAAGGNWLFLMFTTAVDFCITMPSTEGQQPLCADAQADQVTASLAHTQQQKSHLETKVSHLEQASHCIRQESFLLPLLEACPALCGVSEW
jgi:hypothetical protein